MSSDPASVGSGLMKSNSEDSSNPAFPATPPININHLNNHLSKLFNPSPSASHHSSSDLPYQALDNSIGNNNSPGSPRESSLDPPVPPPSPPVVPLPHASGLPIGSISNKLNRFASMHKVDEHRPNGAGCFRNNTNTSFDPITMGLQPQTPGYPMHVPHTCATRSPPLPQYSSSRSHTRRTITLGKPIPYFILSGIHFLLGINRSVGKRTVAGRVFQGLTMAIAAGFIISSLVFIHGDIMSDFTKTTVVDGTVSCLFMLLWCFLGHYANGLAYRLYNNDQFRPLLRLPSKTIFGINSAVLLLILMLLAMAVNNYSGMAMFESTTCGKVSLPVVACKFRFVFRVAFSVLALVWHYLVTFVLIAVSRSFTISIRQLMQTLERDGRAYEYHYMGVRHSSSDDDMLLQEYTWIDEDFCTELQRHDMEQETGRHEATPSTSEGQEAGHPERDALNSSERRSSSCANLVALDDCANSASLNSCAGAEGADSRSDTPLSASVIRPRRPTPDTAATRSLPTTPAVPHSAAARCSTSSSGASGAFAGGARESSVNIQFPPSPTETAVAGARLPLGPSDRRLNAANQSARSSQSSHSRTSGGGAVSCKACEAAKQSVPLLTNAEILYQVWKIQCGLRIFGLATQRWMMSLVGVIVTWLAINLVEWLNTSPGLFDLVNLILPLLLLPLLAATFAEVNFEGERLVKFIAPTEERLGVMFWLQSAPLQLTIYGFSLSYGMITTAGFGVLVALASKVFLQEITGQPE